MRELLTECLPRRHAGDEELFPQTRNIASDEDDVGEDQVDGAERRLRRRDGDVDIAARQRRHGDLAGENDRLAFEDVVRHSRVAVDRRLTECHRRNSSAL